MENVYIVGAARSPIASVKIGKKNKEIDSREEPKNTSSISSLSPIELSRQVLEVLFERSGINSSQIDHFSLGSVISQRVERDTMFQAPAKHILRMACLDRKLDAVADDVSKACSSSLAAIWQTAEVIMIGHADLSIAGGVDMMSRQSNSVIIRGLTDPNTEQLMAVMADEKAKELGYTADAHDQYAFESFERAREHTKQSSMVSIKDRTSGNILLDHDEVVDEYPAKRIVNLQRKRSILLFPDCGIMTFLNSSKYGDAAAFVALANMFAINEYKLKPMARILSYGACGGKEPKNFVIQPTEAINRALKRANLSHQDIDFFEVNEAFPTTCLYLMQNDIPREKINLWGGAIGTGHPIGATGTLLLVKTIDILKSTGKRYAVVSLCNAIDEATAMVIENIGGR